MGVEFGSGSGCSCDPETDLWDEVTQAGSYLNSSGENKYVQFVLSETKCITALTFELRDFGESGNATVTLKEDNSGDPGNDIAGSSVTLTSAEIGDTQSTERFQFSSIITLEAGTYWMGITSDYNLYIFYESGAAGVTSKYFDVTWQDSTFDPEVILKGCTQ